jgi:hypothetical protein
MASELQVLKRLVDSKQLNLNKINSFAGTSAGACISVLLCLGASVDESLDIFNKNLSENPFSDNIASNVVNLFTGCGIQTFDRFNKLFDASIKPYGMLDRSTTFREFWLRTKRDLFITGTNVSKKRLEVFSHYTTPDMSVLTAMQISMSAVPFFKCVKYNGDIYVDGAFALNYPINIFLDPEIVFESFGQIGTLNVDYVRLNNPNADNRKLFPEYKCNYAYNLSIKKKPEEVLGICVSHVTYREGNTLLSLISTLLCCVVLTNMFAISKECISRTITINNTLNHPSFDFSLDAFKYFRQLGDKTYDEWDKKNKDVKIQ